MKLIPHQLVSEPKGLRSSRPQNAARASDKHDAGPVVPIEATQRVNSSGSYSNSAPGYRALTVHSERHDAAVNFYLHTASLQPDTGELIGIDTYA